MTIGSMTKNRTTDLSSPLENFTKQAVRQPGRPFTFYPQHFVLCSSSSQALDLISKPHPSYISTVGIVFESPVYCTEELGLDLPHSMLLIGRNLASNLKMKSQRAIPALTRSSLTLVRV